MNYDRINLRLLFAVLSFAFTVCLAGNTLKNSEAKNEWSMYPAASISWSFFRSCRDCVVYFRCEKMNE